jgi:hypothetical protein
LEKNGPAAKRAKVRAEARTRARRVAMLHLRVGVMSGLWLIF